jgi:hypothetical protein
MKKPRKIIAPLMVVFLLVFGMQPTTFAADIKDVKIFDQGVSSDEPSSIDISGKIPQVDGIDSFDFEKALNKAIVDAKDDAILAAGETAHSIKFSYQKKYNGNIVSLLIYVTETSGSSEQKVISFNFNASDEKMVGLNDPNVLGPNGVKITNKAVAARMLAEPENYNATFAGVSETQDFYMEDDTVTVLFDDFEIAPGYQGIQEIPIALRSIKSRDLNIDQYVTQDNYNLKMIPLSEVLEGNPFYYKLDWNPENQNIMITKGGQFVSRIVIGQNLYSKGQQPMRQLESAPEIWRDKGRTLVPISFFEEILDISFSIDPTGRITFSQYSAPANIR